MGDWIPWIFSMFSSWPQALLAYNLLYFIFLEYFSTETSVFCFFSSLTSTDCQDFSSDVLIYHCHSANSGELSLMHLLAKTIKEVLVWLLPLTEMLLDDHGRKFESLTIVSRSSNWAGFVADAVKYILSESYNDFLS